MVDDDRHVGSCLRDPARIAAVNATAVPRIPDRTRRSGVSLRSDASRPTATNVAETIALACRYASKAITLARHFHLRVKFRIGPLIVRVALSPPSTEFHR
jgi:hypothetical protein